MVLVTRCREYLACPFSFKSSAYDHVTLEGTHLLARAFVRMEKKMYTQKSKHTHKKNP